MHQKLHHHCNKCSNCIIRILPCFPPIHPFSRQTAWSIWDIFITADFPWFISCNCSLLAGNRRPIIGGGAARDHIVEQIPPLTAWGREFYTNPIQVKMYGWHHFLCGYFAWADLLLCQGFWYMYMGELKLVWTCSWTIESQIIIVIHVASIHLFW